MLKLQDEKCLLLGVNEESKSPFRITELHRQSADAKSSGLGIPKQLVILSCDIGDTTKAHQRFERGRERV